MIDPVALAKIQGELEPGESVKWAGRPSPGFRLHSEDWLLIPFSLVFSSIPLGGILSGWKQLSDSSIFTLLPFILFLLIGQYALWGRFIYEVWLKRRTYYGVTTRRIIVLQEAWSRKISATYLEAIPMIEKDGKGKGSLWFGPRLPVFGGRGQPTQRSRFSIGGVPVFADIDNLDEVVRLVTQLRDKVLRELNAKP